MQPTTTQQKVTKFFLALIFLFLTACGNSSNNSSSNNGSSNPVPRVVIAQSQSITTDEDTTKYIILRATGSNNDSLTYTITSQPTKGTLKVGGKDVTVGTTLTGNAPNLIYTPNANENGADSFTFKVNDGKLDTVNDATVSITITPIADLSISDASVKEGNTGTTTLVFTLMLDAYKDVASVDYATSDNTATANDDYIAQTDTVTFKNDSRSETKSIEIKGDTTVESDETFTLTLSNAGN